MRPSFAYAFTRRGVLFSALGLAPALLIGASLLSAPLARAEKRDDTYTLQRTYKMGDVDRFKIDIHTIVSNPQIGDNVDVTMKMLLKETTKEVKSDGNGVLGIEFETAMAKFGDNEMDISSFIPTSTQTRSRMGVVLDTKSDGEAPGPAAQIGKMMQSIFNGERAFYSANPVKVGDSWKIEDKSAKPDGPTSATTGTATLTGTEMIGDMKTVVVKSVTDTVMTNLQKPKGGDDAGADLPKEIKIHFEGVGNVDLATGKIVRSIGSISSNGSSLLKSKLDIKITLATGKDATPDKAAAPDKK